MGRAHPLSRLGSDTRRKTFWVLLIATVLWTIVLSFFDQPVQNDVAPIGMVSFELARTPETAAAMLDSWNHKAQLHLALNLGLDFVYMVLYSTTIAIGCLWITDVPAAKARGPMATLIPVGTTMAWLALLAAVADAFENLSLFQVLVAGAVAPWPAVAFTFALIKFCFLAVTLVFLAGVAIYRLTAKTARYGDSER